MSHDLLSGFDQLAVLYKRSLLNIHLQPRLSKTNQNFKMTDTSTKARLNFLATSAYFYSSTAPSTSAHLMQERNHIALNHNITLKQTDPQRACKACGTIQITGQNSKTTILNTQTPKKPHLKSTKDTTPTNPEKKKQMISQCLVCRRSTNLTPKYLSNPSIRDNKKDAQSQARSSLTTQSLGSEFKGKEVFVQQGQSRSSENSNSKKRAKARKQSGLQAMLDKSKVSQIRSSEPGLDLMDFMKMS